MVDAEAKAGDGMGMEIVSTADMWLGPFGVGGRERFCDGASMSLQLDKDRLGSSRRWGLGEGELGDRSYSKTSL